MERQLRRAGGGLRLNHSGGFDLGVATYVNLVPSEQLGIVGRTNGYPMGIAELLWDNIFRYCIVWKSDAGLVPAV